MRPAVIVFDVNETLSDLKPIADRFEEVGAGAELARTWFAALLRDGFALTTTGENPDFATLAAEVLRVELTGADLGRDIEEATAYIMEGFASLSGHEDMVPGIDLLAGSGFRLATLSNGSSDIARDLLSGSGVAHHFEVLLSVNDAGQWKPASAAYEYATTTLAVVPADALLVAVHPWDLDGAAKCGLRTAWVNRTGARYPSYFRQPDLEARSIVELAQQIS